MDVKERLHTHWPCHKGFSKTTEVHGKKTDFPLSSKARFMLRKANKNMHYVFHVKDMWCWLTGE